jgi:molybdopterin-guanine dinucleotide biosynthesis protein A
MNGSHESIKHTVTGVILSGGVARRMGCIDKGLVNINGKPMIEYMINKLEPQVSAIMINANRNEIAYQRYGFPVVADDYTGFNGPLAGMASCLRRVETEYMVTVPCDCPLIPVDLVARLYRDLVAKQADISVVNDGNRIHPVLVMLKKDMLDSMLAYMNEGRRKVDTWLSQHALAETDFSDEADAFYNINNMEDIEHINFPVI